MSQPTTKQNQANTPTAEELVRRAHEMIPMLRERADGVEKARSVPKDIVQSFKDAGFFKILQPARWGGYEMSPEVFYRVLMELGRGCCNSSWVMMILGIHQWESGHIDERACEDVWGEDNEVIIGSSYAPFGTATPVEGGYRLNGRWLTSSGCDHAQWSFIGAHIRDGDGPPKDHHSFLVPRTDYEIIDDWHTFGLSGTGSKSLELKDVFVPDYRHHSIIDYSLSDRGEMYLWPFNMIFFTAGSSILTGYAEGAIDIYAEQMKTKKSVFAGNMPVVMNPNVRSRLGNAAALVRSCRARILNMMTETTPLVMRRELIPEADRVNYMMDSSSVGRDCQQAVLLLYNASSAKGIFLNNPIQRVLRDTLAAANHTTQNADDHAGILGGFLLDQGLPPGLYEVPGE